MHRVYQLVESVAPSDATVLILGESGTGKELVTRAIHERSQRSNRPFIAVNCSAFTETLLESELFGHTKGAFTGASAYRKGLFQEANGGTLFLDEIGDMPPSTQVKLLRALEEGEIKPVGSNSVLKVDVRIVAATNVDLPAAVKAGAFREDLFYRINVISISIPPLRERTEDIPILVNYFLRKHGNGGRKEVRGISREAMGALVSHRWPGNVRELENVIQRATVLCMSDEIGLSDLPQEIVSVSDPNMQQEAKTFDLSYPEAKRHSNASFDRRYLEDVLARAGGVISEAARSAGMDRSNFRRLLTRYQIDASKYRRG
jgi:DNA-binding NtrC family response regulator